MKTKRVSIVSYHLPESDPALGARIVEAVVREHMGRIAARVERVLAAESRSVGDELARLFGDHREN
ncbi:MAG: hypothetical protein ABFD80_12230 [Acidobacteriota bacterium]